MQPLRRSARLKILVLIAVATLMAACTSEGDGGSSGEAGGEVSRLVYGVPPPTQEAVNPNRDMQPQDEFQLKPMYENLIGSDPETGAWIPMLAERWELEGNALRMFLRQGVQFHQDHGEFTAADVEFTFNDLIDPPGALSGVADALRNSVERLEIVNEYEIVWHLRETSYSFLEGLGYGAAGMAIKSKADWEARDGQPLELEDEPLAGTGPYQFLERTPGENVIFERVPYEHWRQPAGFQELEYRYIPENSTRLSALLAGEIHLTELPEELLQEAEAQGAEIIESAVPGRRIGMSMLGAYLVDPPDPSLPSAEAHPNGDQRKFPDSPMWDVNVRRALSKAIDREALNQAFYGGKAERMYMWYWQPELPGWNPEWEDRWEELYGYDPEAAKELLQEAGYGPGELTVEVLGTPNYGGTESAEVAEAVAGMLADVGVNAPIASMDVAQHTAKREAREFQSAIEFDSTSSEPVTGFEPQGYANQASGRAIASIELDTAYEQVLRELDPEAQAELWREFGDEVFEMVQHIPLLRTRSEVAVDPDVVGDYTFPGAMVSAPFSFTEYITPASGSGS